MGRDGRGVRPASESSIQITFQYKGQRCREIVSLKPTPANLKRAEQFRAAVIHSISIGTFDYGVTFPNSRNALKLTEGTTTTDTVEKYLTKWLTAKKSSLKASTHDGYRKIVDGLLIPQFGDKRLAAWKRRDVKEWLESVEGGNKWLSNIQSVIRSALSDAVEDEYLDSNFMAGWAYSRKEAPKEDSDVDPFSLEEQRIIISEASPMLANLYQFAFWSGLRTAELIALDWSDIDFASGYVRVWKSMTSASKGEAETPKTKSGIRDVRLLRPAREALQSQKEYTYLTDGPVFVFPTTRKRWTGDEQIRKVWARVLKKAGIRYRRPYQTRHTYASMMLSAGEHPMWVAQQMGHSDWAMIRKIYGKWMPDASPDAGAKAEAIFGSGESCHYRVIPVPKQA